MQGTFCSVSRSESRCKLRRSLINSKNTREKSRIIVLILLTLLVCHLLAPRGRRLVGNKRGHSYSLTSKFTSGDLAGKLSGYFGARYLTKERIFDSLISIFSALYIT